MHVPTEVAAVPRGASWSRVARSSTAVVAVHVRAVLAAGRLS